MKARYKILFLALAVLMVASCKQSEDLASLDEPRGIVQLSAKVVGRSGTTSTESSPWAAGDSISVFMLPAGESDLNNAIVSNKKFTFLYVDYSVSPIYYPDTGAVDFVALAPYREAFNNVNETISIDIRDQSNPKALDLLYSDNVRNHRKSNGRVDLEFRHKMAKIKFDLKTGSGISQSTLDTMRIALNGFISGGSYSFSSGFRWENQYTVDALAFSLPATQEGILIPDPLQFVNNRTVEFRSGSHTWTYSLPRDHIFEEGKEYTYEMTFTPKSVELTNHSIQDWTVNASIQQTVTPPEYVYIQPGTFQMGSPESDQDAFPDEKPQHWVRFDKGFYMSKTPITQQQYCYFLNATNTPNSEGFKKYVQLNGKWVYGFLVNESLAYNLRYVSGQWQPVAGAEDYPMNYVTFYGALAYAKWAGGTLPTEEQWEYAARAGGSARWPWGDAYDAAQVSDWYDTRHYPSRNAKDRFQNAWGLYAMGGFIGEYCFDAGSYPHDATSEADAVDGMRSLNETINDDLQIPKQQRIRGVGSFWSSTQSIKSASRTAYRPGPNITAEHPSIGFRVVINP